MEQTILSQLALWYWVFDIRLKRYWILVSGKKFTTFSKLFQTNVSPILESASEVWGYKDYIKCEWVQQRAAHYYLDVYNSYTSIGDWVQNYFNTIATSPSQWQLGHNHGNQSITLTTIPPPWQSVHYHGNKTNTVNPYTLMHFKTVLPEVNIDTGVLPLFQWCLIPQILLAGFSTQTNWPNWI